MKYISVAILVAFFCASVHCFDDNNAYLKAYQDYANLIGEKSKCNGFEESWSKMQTKLQEHFDLWKKCPDEKSDLSIITCKVREGATIHRLIEKYLHQAEAKDISVVLKIKREASQQITGFAEAQHEYHELTKPRKFDVGVEI